MSTTRITASRGADLLRAYTFPDTDDLSAWTGVFTVYDDLGGSALLTVTQTPNANGSSIAFAANVATLLVRAADIDALAVAAPPTDPAFYYYDFLVNDGALLSKFQGGGFRILPVGAEPDCVEPLEVSFSGETISVEVAARGLTGPAGPQGATGADGAKGDKGDQGLQGIKGDPGGNVMAVGLFTDIAGQVIPSGVGLVHTSGYATSGYGAAAYVYDATVDAAYVAANPYASALSANGLGYRLCETRPTPHMFGARGDGVTDQVTRLQAWIDHLRDTGHHGQWGADTGTWVTSRLQWRDHVKVFIDPTVSISIPAGGLGFIYAADTLDMLIESNGATITGNTANASSLIYLAGAQRPTIRGLTLATPGSQKDCIYIGAGATYTACKDVIVERCDLSGAGRNNISVVSCDGYYIQHSDIHGSIGNLVGAGIDVEANTFTDTQKRGHIRWNRIRDNHANGIIVTFGDDVQIYGNVFSGNGAEGVIVAAGGASNNTGVARSGIEWRAITALDTVNGWISVTNADTLDIGSFVTFGVRNGGVLPASINGSVSSYWFVTDKDSANTKVRVSAAGTIYSQVNSLSDAGSGVLTSDPTTSAMYLHCFNTPGQASNVKIFNNKFMGNNGGHGECCVSAGGLIVDIYDNDFDCTTSSRNAVYLLYCQHVRVLGNRGRGYKSVGSTAVGFTVTSSSQISFGDNTWSDFQGYGENVGSVWALRKVGRDTIYNCGKTNNIAVYLQGIVRGEVCYRVRNDPGYVTTLGIQSDANCTYCVIDGCDVKGSGVSNGNSLGFTSSTNIFRSNVVFDGSAVHGRWGSTTYDAPSIASGASVTTTVSVAGAALGDAVDVSLGLTLSGLSASGYVSATGTVTAVIANNTGAAIDLASTTIRATARRIYS